MRIPVRAIVVALLLLSIGYFSPPIRSDLNAGTKPDPASNVQKAVSWPNEIGEISALPESSRSMSPNAGCELLNYLCNYRYYFRLPSEFGDEFYAMRFSLPDTEPCTLVTVGITLYGEDSQNLSGQGIMLYVMDDNGSGFPENVLASEWVMGEDIIWYPSSNVVTLSSPVIVPPEFHVAYSVVDPGQDIFSILSDDGSCGSMRSSALRLGVWQPISALYSVDVNFDISAEVCCAENTIPYITNHPDTLRQSYCSDMYYDFYGEDTDGEETWFEFQSGPGAMEMATGEWSYQPSEIDVGEHLLSYRICDASGCSDIMSTVVMIENYEPILQGPCGTTIEGLAGDRILFTVEAIGPEECDNLSYSVVSGPGTIDPVTGVYSWETDPADVGSWVVDVVVSDGMWDVGPCSFNVLIGEVLGTCGDANGDGGTNVGDAVYLISYVFKGGPAPDPLWTGDANDDGAVNVGDAVYIIAYVFKGGPAPCIQEKPCCNAPPCDPNPVVPVTYTEIPSPTPNCGGNFGLWQGWDMTAEYDACCLDGNNWQMRVTKVTRPYSISVCTQGRTDVNGPADIANVEDCKKAVGDLGFNGAPAPGRPAKNDYTSTDCTRVHEETHQAESKAAIDAAWIAGEAAIEALQTPCVIPACDTPGEAVAAMKAAADAILRNTQNTAAANRPTHGPPDTSGAYAAQKTCHDNLIAALRAAFPGC